MLHCIVGERTDKQVKPQEKYSTIHVFSLCGAAGIIHGMKEVASYCLMKLMKTILFYIIFLLTVIIRLVCVHFKTKILVLLGSLY